ncbi:class I SAM-dependent methyltransferase [Streptomyces sp. XM4193]|uniref:class I SAM-dependent methyltransferase n=1 Tax=Streptomyces sp. XM4193 TaxID=2929782 RepID=UPI001FFBBEEE|nr:class I SAM-dependent methyltransferase [Streptomyces sp. XM4193]MCK1795486.1 class I SAM-dependent methyltransferase [Streptomyces sp. XM4193]
MARVAVSDSTSTPPDAVDSFARLLTPQGQQLLDELRNFDPAQELAVATRLRREHPPELVSAAIGQARLRQRAVAKFGAADASRMYFTPDGLEQATRSTVATYRAERIAAAGVRRLVDVCCGVGGDALALARAGVEVLAVDRSPLTCAVLAANAAALGLDGLIEVRRAEAADLGDEELLGGPEPYDAVFVDPARRGGRGRIFDPEAYSPPLSWAGELAARMPCAALKIAPGVPHEAIPPDAEAEWISVDGEVKEAVLWFGGLAQPAGPIRPAVRATLLPERHSLIGEGLPDPQAGPVLRYLYEPDGAVIRSHLVAELARDLDARLIDPTIAYLTADELRTTPYARAYEITDALPFNLKRLKALLREREVGTLTVKKRGSPIEPEELRRKVKPRGPASATVFLTRTEGAPAMLLGHPVTGT